MTRNDQIPPLAENAPQGVRWECPECGATVRPKFYGDSFAGYRVICTRCGEGNYTKTLPWGGGE